MEGRAAIVCRWMLAVFALTRLSLWFRPNADVNVGPYNIHHLFTGVLILAAGVSPRRRRCSDRGPGTGARQSSASASR